MITLLLFANLQEEIGQNKLTIEDENMTVEELKKWIKSTYNVSNINSVMVAINDQYAVNTDKIHNGDVVALIPPLSGG